MIIRKTILACLYLFVCFAAIEAESRRVVQSGHLKGVNDFVYDPSRNLLISSSEDGTVRIFNADSREVLYTIRVAYRRLSTIAVHPQKSLFAVIEVSGSLSSVIHVIDWETGNTLYTVQLEEIPLFLNFSPGGTYLVYGLMEWKSIIFCDALSGKKLPLLESGFGIVSFVTVSKNEDKIMAYQPSGKITYWEINTEKPLLAKPIETLASLQALSLSENRRFLAASYNDKLVIIDTVTGNVGAKTSLAGITRTVFHPDGKTVYCITKKDSVYHLNKAVWNGASLTVTDISPKGGALNSLTAMTYIRNRLYFSDSEGSIQALNEANGTIIPFSENILIEISDLAFTEKWICFGYEQNIITFPLNILEKTGGNPGKEPLFSSYENPFKEPVGLLFYSPTELLVWTKSDNNGRFMILDAETGEPRSDVVTFPSPLISVDSIKNHILTLEKNGNCTVLTRNPFQKLFTYKAPGLNKVIFASNTALIGAKSKLSARESPLIIINPKTEETVPVKASSLLCYEIAYDENSASLYSLSIERNDSGNITFLKSHTGKDLEKEISLYAFYDEDTQATLALDRETGMLYTSVGYNEIHVLKDGKVRVFTETRHPARKLYISGSMLLSINRDYSITVYDKATEALILDLYFFKDSSFVVFFPDGTSYSYKNGGDYVRTYTVPEPEKEEEPATLPVPDPDAVLKPLE
ncbi:MAG: PQQ-binding-like beta-propeller repeat protein [Spirochaetales bacterium]|nr:PQQ-binding-like beta-propeller repeat protein [Spirochaetales bacterium]